MYAASYPSSSSSHHPPSADTYRPSNLSDTVGSRLSLINTPIQFTEGQWAGRTVRAELTEIQKADLGRKYTLISDPIDIPDLLVPDMLVWIDVHWILHP